VAGVTRECAHCGMELKKEKKKGRHCPGGTEHMGGIQDPQMEDGIEKEKNFARPKSRRSKRPLEGVKNSRLKSKAKGVGGGESTKTIVSMSISQEEWGEKKGSVGDTDPPAKEVVHHSAKGEFPHSGTAPRVKKKAGRDHREKTTKLAVRRRKGV